MLRDRKGPLSATAFALKIFTKRALCSEPNIILFGHNVAPKDAGTPGAALRNVQMSFD